MMVGWRSSGLVLDKVFRDLECHLGPGDALVVNTSAHHRGGGARSHRRRGGVLVHFSAPLAPDRWSLEVRTPIRHGSQPGPR